MKQLVLLTLLLAGCQPSLNRQPRHKDLDGAARPVPAGTRLFRASAPGERPVGARLARGHELYDVHCTACHGLTGDAGLVTLRGFSAIPSLNTPRARALPEGVVKRIVLEGRGAMMPMQDRLAATDAADVALFLRALQLSQHASAAQLEARDRLALGKEAP